MYNYQFPARNPITCVLNPILPPQYNSPISNRSLALSISALPPYSPAQTHLNILPSTHSPSLPLAMIKYRSSPKKPPQLCNEITLLITEFRSLPGWTVPGVKQLLMSPDSDGRSYLAGCLGLFVPKISIRTDSLSGFAFLVCSWEKIRYRDGNGVGKSGGVFASKDHSFRKLKRK